MVISHSHSQPLLCHRADNHNDPDPLAGAQGSSDGSLRLSGGSAPRARSYDDMVGSCIRYRGSDGVDIYLKRRQTSSGYVSFEDVIDSREFREGNGRPPEAGISDPPMRTSLRRYSCGAARPRQNRRRSPGPLGTHRGSAMHRFVKKYVNPCLALVARAFDCIPGVAAH